MTNKEYNKAKEECWVDFCRKFLPEADSEATMKDVIDYAFDRAYALGKEVVQKGRPLNAYITDEDKENVRAEYNAMVKAYESPRNNGEKEYAKGYMEALEWLFGIRFLTNQQKDNE